MKKQLIHLLIFAGCTFMAAGTVFAQDKNAGAMKMPPPPTVMVDTVKEVMETGTKKYMAKLLSVRSVDLPARVSAKLEKCLFKEGDFVKEGDLLFQLEDEIYLAAQKAAQAQLMQAESNIIKAAAVLEQADANLEYAEDEFERVDRLLGVSSQKEYDAAARDLRLAKAVKAAAEGDLATAKASKVAAEAALMTANTNLSYTQIKADFTGRIGKSTYAPGNFVTPSSGALANLSQIDPIYVRFAISEPDYVSMFGSPDNVRKDAVVRIRLSDRTMYDKTANVTIVDNKIDQSTGTIMLWARMDNKEMRLTPGGLVDAMISKKTTKKMPAIPVSALQIGKGGQFVWVLGENNMLTRQPVIPGETIGNLQVVTGVQPGQTIVTYGAHKIIAIPGLPVIVNPVRASK